MRGSSSRAIDDFTTKLKGFGRGSTTADVEDPAAPATEASSSWFSKIGNALPSMAEAAAAAKAGDFNALSKAASSAQQGFQQGFSDITGKAKGMAKQASTTISENAISRERWMTFFGGALLGCFLMSLAFVFLPIVVLMPQKFALLFTLGSLCFLGSFSALRGHAAFARHLFSRSRLPFTLTYSLSMGGTLWASLIYRSYLLTIAFSAVQVSSLVLASQMRVDVVPVVVHSWREARAEPCYGHGLEGMQRMLQVRKQGIVTTILRHGLVAQASVGPCLMPRRSRENVFAVASLVDSALDFPFTCSFDISGQGVAYPVEARQWARQAVPESADMLMKWLALLGASAQGCTTFEELPSLPLQTSGRYIVDSQGRRVRLHCVNWYGAHLPQLAANGLNRQTAGEIARTIVASGFNCVRLPFSLDGVVGNISRLPNPEVSLAANPAIQDVSPLELFDVTVHELTANGLMVILNNHVSTSMWCCSTTDQEGLWYTSAYPESAWLHALGLMTSRYKDNPLVVGFDLRNEIRPSGFAWPGWHTNDARTDWAAASVRGARRVLDANENMLIIISGVYFGLFLCQVPTYPVHTEVPFLRGRVVYTAHEYNWFNFHFLAREIIQIYCLVLAVVFVASWLLSALVRRGRRSPNPATQRILRYFYYIAGCTRCRCRSMRADERMVADGTSRRCGLEFTVAALLTALCALCLKVVPLFVHTCAFDGFMAATLCAVFAPTLALVSLVLWIRAAFLAFTQHLEPADLRTLRPSRPTLPLPENEEPVPSEPYQRSCTTTWHVKQCRSPGCVLLLVACVAFSGLSAIWVEFGSYEAFERELDFKWGFLLSGSAAAPVWLGEFGTNTESLWWEHMLRYLQKRDLDFAYWSVNGEKFNGEPESFGLFMENFIDVKQPWKLQQLQATMKMQIGPELSSSLS
ncbi:unnamed protein product [Symbiodinium sp. KB8]|nr:unnamed protein product [Symbiodinium sp. KB8]